MPADGSRADHLSLAFLGDPNSVHTRRWLAFFAQRGHSVHLFVPTDEEIGPGLDPRIDVSVFPAYRGRRLPVVGPLQARHALRTLLRSTQPDVLHAHYLTRYGWWARASGFRPYVITPWGSDVLIVVQSNWRRRLWGWLALAGADLVTVHAAHVARAAMEAGAKPSRMRTVHFGVDTAAFAPGAARQDLRRRLRLNGRRVIFSARRVAPLYLHETVIDALVRLPDDVVVLMGKRNADPSYLRVLEERIARSGVADRVRMVDEIADDEMADLYRLADVVVSVPWSDGVPATVLEAMACQRPVVATDLPGVRDFLAPVTPGLLVPVRDPVATADALDAALSLTPDEQARITRALREAVVERADYATSMASMESHYFELAQQKRQ